MTKKTRTDMKIEKYIGMRMLFHTKEGDFEGEVVGCMWLGSAFIELDNPKSFFNTHMIIYAKEILE